LMNRRTTAHDPDVSSTGSWGCPGPKADRAMPLWARFKNAVSAFWNAWRSASAGVRGN
jgi:hypothetical protein